MPDTDFERLLKEPIYALDFQFMIGDVEDFLEFSEINIEWQYRRELQAIARRAETEAFPDGYREHLESNAEHRFKVSLPLRVRYGALIALTTSVEWSVGFLVARLKKPLSTKPKERNETAHALLELNERTDMGKAEVVRNYEALVQVRNCIAHSAGLVEHYRHREQLPASIARLAGFALCNGHFFGKHICIERSALTPYVREMGLHIIQLHKVTHEKDLLHDGPLRTACRATRTMKQA